MKPACVLLAAGAGIRFGGDKLKAPLAGKPLVEYILSALPQDRFCECLMVAADSELLAIAGRYNVRGMINNRPDMGASRSIRMGLRALPEADACMFCVCDQPLIESETIGGMAKAYVPGTILALSSHGKRGNPVIFPSSVFEELKSLPPGGSGKTVVAAHPDMMHTYVIEDKAQLLDVDTRIQLDQIEALLLTRRQSL